jgi:hypothetical protein
MELILNLIVEAGMLPMLLLIVQGGFRTKEVAQGLIWILVVGNWLLLREATSTEPGIFEPPALLQDNCAPSNH